MNERDKELMSEAEAYADYNFKGEVYWREAYESKLVELIRADERGACEIAIEELMPDASRSDCATAIRARGNT